MKRGWILAVMLLCSRTAAADTGARTAQFLLDELRVFVEVPGLSAAVAIDDRVAWTGVSGLADVASKRPLTAATRMRLASVSKLLAATLVLRVADAGRIDLDGDIRKCVPSWPDDSAARITPRRLASHTAGLRHYSPEDGDVEGRHFDTLTDAVPIYAGRSAAHAPGAGYIYSSWGYALLGACVEGATGASFAEALSRHVLQPLALDETFVEDVRALPASVTTLYERRIGKPPESIVPNDQSYGTGATGIRSTPRDLVRLASAWHAGRAVTDTTRAMAWTPVSLDDGGSAGNDRFGVGFGWRIGRDWDERRVVHHAGVTPGARSILLAYPGASAAVALLSNSRWTSRIETTAELLAAPFLESVASGLETCPVGEWEYSGRFHRGEGPGAMHGTIAIEVKEGVCRGRIDTAGALAQWVDTRAASTRLAMARVARRDEGVHVFAFVQPWGLSPLRLRLGKDGSLAADGDIAGTAVQLSAPAPKPASAAGH